MTHFSFERELRFGDCDPSGIAYFPSYLNILNGVVEDFWAGIGFPWPELITIRKIGTPTVHLACDFSRPSMFGDLLTFNLRITRVGGSSLHLDHVISGASGPRWRARQILAATSLVDHHAIPWPDDIRAALASHVSGRGRRGDAGMISLFMAFSDSAGERRVRPAEVDAVAELVGSIPEMTEAMLFTPLEQSVDHPYKADGSGPVFALQLRFPNLFACEAAMDRGSILASLATGAGHPGLTGLNVTHQVMLTRAFPVDVAEHPAGTTTPCSYLVHYPGPAADMNAWNLHYLEHHPAIMRTFPGVRQIEIHTRIDWVDRLPSQRVEHMQRNKLVFDSPEALAHALASDVIKQMRADFVKFPPFAGGNKHFPMLTRVVRSRTGA